MVSVADLLNPEPPRAPLPSSRPIPASPSRRIVSFADDPAPVRPSIESLKMTNHAKLSAGNKVKGAVNFPPFEALDEASLALVRKFRVQPFGSIQDTCRLIPYNSGKKDFFSKTGREFFEVFQYDFKIPGNDTFFTVMWDYNVGLVRMTPFFKCHGYSKTTPAKMLSQNPGLKDITYSITGGSIKAQGYWMPFSCAKAVCATFCHKIAGALIPLFGPRFPLECIPEKAVGHGRMVIDPAIVARAKRDAAGLFCIPHIPLPSPRPSHSISPPPPPRFSFHTAGPYRQETAYGRHPLPSPYATDADLDLQPGTEAYSNRPMYPTLPPLQTSAGRPSASGVLTPMHSPGAGWTTVNRPPPLLYPHHHRSAPSYCDGSHERPFLAANTSDKDMDMAASPWLSAVPRSPTPPHRRHYFPGNPHHHQSSSISTSSSSENSYSRPSNQSQPAPSSKRVFEHVDTGTDEEGYEAGCGNSSSSRSPTVAVSPGGDRHAERAVRSTAETTITVATCAPASDTAANGASSAPAVGDNDAEAIVQSKAERRATERDVALALVSMHGHCATGVRQQQQERRQQDGEGDGGDRGDAARDRRSENGKETETEATARRGSGKAILPTAPAAEGSSIAVRGGHRMSTRAKRRRTLA